ncbi:MAG: OmpA family protein [Opitutales bacterium]|nr:OmpA family protein [Opitutales bacterium]
MEEISKIFYPMAMKKSTVFLLLCLSLSGCRRWISPNPQVSDTVTVLSIKKTEVKTMAKPENNASWFCLYDEKNVIGRIYFEFDRAVLSEADQQYLEHRILAFLEENAGQRLLLAGYADWFGREEYNKNLGLRRAKSVAEFLTQKGISPDRFELITLGNREATQGISKADAVKDRRCDIVKIP